MIKKIIHKLRKIRHTHFLKQNQKHLKNTNKLYLSFGENCLTDHILNRYALKSFTTPFSHGRSNIEYILNLENDQYKNFLSLENLKFEDLNGKMVPRLKIYDRIKNNYNPLHINGFEFTHHDVINSNEIREKFQQRVSKLKSGLGKNKYIILYHHRICKNNNSDLLLKNLADLKSLYSRNNEAEIVLFKQIIINKKEDRKIKFYKKSGINIFDFYTLKSWEGDDPNLLWAYNDEDLIKKMIRKIKNI